MIIKRLARSIRQQDWFAVAAEILVVVVGLMLAFQLDRWWEKRGERVQEAEYVARLIAGVLNYEHARLVQDTWYVVAPGDLEKFDSSQLNISEVQASVERFRSRKELLAWLPELRHLQIEQIIVNENRLEKAKGVLNLLREYAAKLD